MNIGIFTDTYYPEINGVVTSIRILEKELTRRGHKVYIFTTTHPEVKRPDSKVFRLPSIPFLFLPSRRVGMVYSPQVAKNIRQLNLDIIHTQTEFSLGTFGKMMARRLGIPVVHTYHTMYKDYVHYISRGKLVKFATDFARAFSRNYCKNCRTIIAPTKKVEDLLREYGVSRPIRIIPTGVDLAPFRKENFKASELADLRRQFGLKEKQPVVLFIGRLAKEKSVDVIVSAMPSLLKKLPDAKLVIVGDGPQRKDLALFARNLQCEHALVFAGEQPWEKIGKFYQLGNVFVSASITETQGLTFAEAMAAGIPLVVKRDKSIEGIVKDHINGRVFEKDMELSDILFEVLSNKKRAEEMIQNAYHSVELISSEHFGKSVEAVYDEVLGRLSELRTPVNA